MILILKKSKKLSQQGTFAGHIAERLEAVDKVHNETLQMCRDLRKEIPKKHAEAGELALKLAKKLKKDPKNKQLQKDYAAATRARDMYVHGNHLNEALLGNANQ